jgi:hypothetical protein
MTDVPKVSLLIKASEKKSIISQFPAPAPDFVAS